MTIDEMIAALSDEPMFCDVWVDEEICIHIIAALLRLERLEKAGQAMYKDLDENEAGYTAGQAAWDAATTKGDDV